MDVVDLVDIVDVTVALQLLLVEESFEVSQSGYIRYNLEDLSSQEVVEVVCLLCTEKLDASHMRL